MKINSINQLISELNQCQGTQFGDVLAKINLDEKQIAEIEKQCEWSETYYTRNLIERNDNYELLFLCWEPGQISSIHNHAGQHCWVKVLQGLCEEKLYICNNDELKLIKSSVAEKGCNAYIDDEIALHSLQNVGKNRMITLHLYSNPIESCYSYDKATGQKKLVQTKYNKILKNEK